MRDKFSKDDGERRWKGLLILSRGGGGAEIRSYRLIFLSGFFAPV